MMHPTETFPGFAPPVSNTTYTPNQFFDVVLPHASRGAVRLVAYLLRKTLGWCDAEGNPQEPEVEISYRQLEQHAGIGHSSIRGALEEALASHYILCVRSGKASCSGLASSSALYALRWDENDTYLNRAETFRGFFAGNGNRTYIPNSFFDQVIPGESLAVVRVVGVILRNTIGYQNRYGFRRQQVAMSLSEIQKRTGIKSQTNICKALQYALQANYLIRIEEGHLDLTGGRKSSPAVYRLSWQDDNQTPILAPSAEFADTQQKREKPVVSDHSEKSSGTCIYHSEKSSGDHSEKSSGDHSEKSSGIKIKQNKTNINKNNNSTVVVSEAFSVAVLYRPTNQSSDSGASKPKPAPEDPLTSEISRSLQNLGFDDTTTHWLISHHPLPMIRQQIEWLSDRKYTRNKLGLLRRAIEENWGSPESSVAEVLPSPLQNEETLASEPTPTGLFASSFYAGWADNPGTALASPSRNDLISATPYIQFLLECGMEEAQASEWGRRLGAFVREAEKNNPKVVRSLVYALRVHGDSFLTRARNEIGQKKQRGRETEKRAHHTWYQKAYQDYLRRRETEIRNEEPVAYETFEADEATKRTKFECGILARSKIAERMREAHDREEERLARFGTFFQQESLPIVLDFWNWDTQENPKGFSPS
ncbi:MAG: hypothetical protein H7308_02840 [Chthonomonadaceae bacterium]|nr:hypothetical protein [Chthonomonadaceae bacterium]